MDEYITKIKENYYKEATYNFLMTLPFFVVSLFISYLFWKLFSVSKIYMFTSPYSMGDGFISLLSDIAESLFPCTAALVLIYFSVYTSVGKYLSAFIGIWRGLSLGCFISVYSSNATYGIGVPGGIIASLYFLSSVLLFALSAYASVHAKTVSYKFISRERRNILPANAEFTKSFLVISGVIYLTSVISFIII